MVSSKFNHTKNFIDSPRVVLVEKTNRKLVWTMEFLTNIQLFSTEVIPLLNNQFLVYQESKKAAAMVFGKNSNIVIARVIILKNILKKNTREHTHYKDYRHFNISAAMDFRPLSNEVVICGSMYEYSFLCSIPINAKIHFIQFCKNFNSSRSAGKCFEYIPLFKIPVRFSPESLTKGTFLCELKPNHSYVGATLQNCWIDKLSLFKRYVDLYDKGLWEKTNKKRNLNKFLN